jgi:hypothetical protein
VNEIVHHTRRLASHARPEPHPDVRIVTECRGREWAIVPALRTVYVLAGSPAEVGRRVAEALAVWADPRPRLTLVQ